MNTSEHVLFYQYSPITKEFERFHALVIGSRESENHDEPILHLVIYRHDKPNAHHALSGTDWADTIERVLDVPHKSDLGNQSFYYLHEEDEPDPLLGDITEEEMDAAVPQADGDSRHSTEEQEKAAWGLFKGQPATGALAALARNREDEKAEYVPHADSDSDVVSNA